MAVPELEVVARYSGPGNPIAGYFCQQNRSTAALDFWRLGARAMTTLLATAQDDEDQVVLDLSQGVERFPHEVLLLAGACNEIIGPAVQAEHRRLFPKARLEVIPNAGHTMLGERPQESQAIIRRYFQQVP
jgi:pimeloyl-ACP methyl ester carboxylesterase